MSKLQKLFNEAMFHFNNRNHLEAEKAFRKILREDRKNVPALNLLTIVLMNTDRFSEAEEFISAAVKLNQSSDVSFYNFGLILKQLNRPEAALEQFSKALQLKRDVPATWNNRGAIRNELKQYPQAILDFEEALRLQPKYPEALANKGKSLALLRRYREAIEAYDQALALDPSLAEARLGRGNVFDVLKRHDEAIADYEKALSIRPDLDGAWLNLGNTLTEINRSEGALHAYGNALSLNPNIAEAWLGRANALFNLKAYNDAQADYAKALALKPDLAEAWLGEGNIQSGSKRYDEAQMAYKRALALKPDLENAWLGLGNVMFGLQRYGEALAAYDKAMELQPGMAEAWVGRGSALVELKCHDDAFAAYNQALSLKPNLPEALSGRGNILFNLKHYDQALAAYEEATSLKPDLENAWLGLGNVLAEVKRYDEALLVFDKALSLQRDLEKAWLGRGNALFGLKRYDEAFGSYDQALALRSGLAEAWLGRGNVLHDLKRHVEAFASYDKAFSLEPNLIGLEGMRLQSKMFVCDWQNFDEERRHAITSIRDGRQNVPPFAFLALSSSPDDQANCARTWCAKSYPASSTPIWQGNIFKHDKIRIGYVSADFHEHATSYLMANMFECHDRSKFEITAISIGIDDDSQMRRRLKSSFDTFIDARTISDEQIARTIHLKEIDLLVDLKGFTEGARTGIFARRPSPIQISYLGYPGTMGAEYFDYLIADRVVVPESHQSFYAEKIVYLPHSYQVNDPHRLISDYTPTREEIGLPKFGFVYCCFNNNYKITPEIFDVWMQILKETEGSVIWLLEDNHCAAINLRREAEARGISAERLVFAERVPLTDHLARHRLADLFLDTLPYNAHTTASDALWAGLPVLTQIGDTFAGRVAASLLSALGMPELITRTREEYMRLAIELGSTPGKLAHFKARLGENRTIKPLFDAPLLTRDIERTYEIMYSRYQQALPVDHILLSP